VTSEVVVSLDSLAEEIRSEHQACLQSLRKGMEHALKVGELLLQARKLVKHGDWTNWVETNCEFTPRMARNYMKLAGAKSVLKPEIISEMTLRDALNRVDFETRKLPGEWKRTREERKKRWKLENEDRQVKEFLDAVKVFLKSVRDAVDVAEFGKFSPEGARFTVRRMNEVRQELDRLEEVFKTKEEEL